MEDSLFKWLDYIAKLHVSAIDLDLQRILPLARQLGLCQFDCPVITVGGTNGKGSVVRCCELMYLAAGYRVAAYTSPHLIHFNERLRINGQNVSDEQLIAAMADIEQQRQSIQLSFFEFTTLVILSIIKSLSVDVILLEVGLGGRLDAVNVVDSDIAVVTTVDIDHTEWLGHTREAIGREKAGIFRQGKPVVCGDSNPPETLIEHAKTLKSPCYIMGQEFNYQQTHLSYWSWFSQHKRYQQLPVPALQIHNAATSLMTTELLQAHLPLSQSAICQGLIETSLPGRFELQRLNQRTLILDVAHNNQSVAYLASQLAQRFTGRRLVAVFSMLADKMFHDALRSVAAVVSHWYLGSLEAPRAATREHLTLTVQQVGVQNYTWCDTVTDAYQQAMFDSKPDDCIVIFGSFHTVSAVQAALN